MRRKALVIALVLSVVVFTTMAFAFQNEPEGFRGLKWGDPPGEDMVIITLSRYGRTEYKRVEEKLYMGEAKLEQVVYCFYLDEFMTVFLHFRGEDNFSLLKTICREKFGEPTDEKYNQLIWMTLGGGTTVMISYRLVKGTGAVVLANMEILQKCQAARKKEEAESAEEDW